MWWFFRINSGAVVAEVGEDGEEGLEGGLGWRRTSGGPVVGRGRCGGAPRSSIGLG
jgi:hypothetical protein